MMMKQPKDCSGNAALHSSEQEENRFHRRSVSDPFDAQQGDENVVLATKPASPRRSSRRTPPSSSLSNIGVIAEATSSSPQKAREQTTSSSANGCFTYWTLPRYPVAATRDKNCWSEPPVSIFNVRGSNYFVDQKKQVSMQYLMPARGCDLFLSEQREVDLNAMYVCKHCCCGTYSHAYVCISHTLVFLVHVSTEIHTQWRPYSRG
jgi:Protein ENHANCED DISEASE RESISTANCE 2, C-terminal